ncbi:5-formyltetrahydrofolate cyclo-ligase [Candidatus Gracilibacteria bacterium]|nr:5-formyltetrahydrofolate cyclo-ligase [Candidatus Gracilibacteria bacterium]
MKFTGKVIRGKQIGTKFGIATANLETTEDLDLEEGVYFVRVKNKRDYQGVLFFGPKKTFTGERTIEVHILDLDEDLYGHHLEVEVLQKAREVEKFDKAEDLFAQIKIDIIWTRKFFLRKEVFVQWKQLSASELEAKTKLLNKKIVQYDKLQESGRVFVYSPTTFELPFVENMCKSFPDKRYFFPKIVGDKLEFYEAEFQDLRKGKFGLLEPVGGHSELPKKEDLIFVPAVAVDKEHNRLGRGGGYYDRFLKDLDTHKVAVIPDFSYVTKVPTEGHDVKVDEVIVV